MSRQLRPAFAAVLALAFPPLAQQGNEVFPSNGGEQLSLMNVPSVGGPTGAPTFGADLFWKGLPEMATVHPSGQVHLVSLEDLFVATVDWPGAVASGGPVLHDLGIAPTSAARPGDPLLPDFFTTGSLNALVSVGSLALPHPCVVSPTSTCSSSAACPPPVRGYTVDLDLGQPFAVGANPTDTAGTAAVWFLPGGMVYSTSAAVGACGLGDYVFVGAQSLDEHQASATTIPGASWTEGFQLGDPSGVWPTGPLVEAARTLSDFGLGFAELVAEPVFERAATIGGFPPERGAASLAVSPSPAGLTFGVRVVGGPHLAGGIAFTASSAQLLPGPFYVFGLPLMIAPTGYFSATLSAWGTAPPLAPVDDDGDGLVDQAETETPRIPVPPGAVGDVFVQSFVFPLGAPPEASTVWRARFQ